MFHVGQVCGLCHDTGFNEETGRQCHCIEGSSQEVVDSYADFIVDELEDQDEDERLSQDDINILVGRDYLGRFLVIYDCDWPDKHYAFMAAEQYLAKGGDPSQLKRMKHYEISSLWLPRSKCSFCAEIRHAHEYETRLMLDWGWEPTPQEEAEIPVS